MGLFANYDVEDIIAEGEMATVYKCLQSSDKHPVAVKLLSQQFVAKHPEIVDYFDIVSATIARMNHPNIVHVIDSGVAGGLPFFVMEFVDGVSLNVAMERGALDFNKKLDVVVQICKALAYAHKNGVIHYAFKPANVLLDREGNVQVTDFGIAQIVKAKPSVKNTIMSAPEYMSPEQKSAQGDLTRTTDIYALGVIMYEMFTGQLPGEPLTFPSYHDSSIPAYLDEVITTCLKIDPNKRYPSAQLVQDKLLDEMYGAHVEEPKKSEVLKGIGDLKTRFAVLDVIKESRFGSVYLCENTVNHNRLIIKKVKGTDQGYKECTALGNLQHPNVVNIYSTSKEGDVFFIVMEYLPGGSLSDRLVNAWDWKTAVKVTRDICMGLAFLHKNQLVHGNVRPSNILFTNKGEAKITDCCLDEHYQNEETETNWYVYPNEPKNFLADEYSAGAILFEMLTGTLPQWKKGSLVANEQFGSLPVDLQNIVQRMIAQVPKDRFGSLTEVVNRLEAMLNVDTRKGVKKQKQKMSGTMKFLLFLLSLSAISAIAYYYIDANPSVIDPLKNWMNIN